MGFVDQEHTRWYPEYWDCVKFFERHSKYPDWKDHAADIFLCSERGEGGLSSWRIGTKTR